MRNKKFLSIIAIAFAFALVIGIGNTAEAGEKGAITLDTMGVFWVGGQVVDSTDPALAGHKTLSGGAYVEYFIPQKKSAIPVILVHRVISGVIFQSTTDGREGWAQYFVRQGFPVYVVEPPVTGRAAFDVDAINLAATGQRPPLTSAPLVRGDSATWAGFAAGPAFGVVGPPGGNQMATDPEALKRFLGAVGVPRQNPAPSFDATGAVFIQVLEKTGPAIWIGWSSAGTNAMDHMVIDRPDLFRALITIEPGGSPCAGPPSPTLVNTLVNNHVPFLNVTNMSTVNNNCQALVNAINQAGGDAAQINLPDIGIFGNGHMMFFEKNSDDIAKVIVDWTKKHVK